jgi:hypothetical protein
MAESDAVEELRSSLARRRASAYEKQKRSGRVRIPTVEEILQSRPVALALRHPVLSGLAVGAVYLIGPLRLLRAAATAASLAQSVLAARSAYHLVTTPEDQSESD